MVQLTKLNGDFVFVNPDLVRWVEAAPDTVLTFVDGVTLVVRETAEAYCQKVCEFKVKSLASGGVQRWNRPSTKEPGV